MHDSHSRVPPSKYCKNICEKPIIGTHIVPFIILYSVNRRLLVVDFVVLAVEVWVFTKLFPIFVWYIQNGSNINIK